MNIPKCAHIVLPLALLGAFSPPGLMAQEGPYSVRGKIRLGLTAGDVQQAHFDNKAIAFAAEVRRDMKDMLGGALKGAFAAELAWEFVPGRHHDIYPWGENPFRRMDGAPLDIRYGNFDDRKEYGQGINLKLAYYSQMPQAFGALLNNVARDMEWFAGLSIDRYKVRSEVKFTFNYATGATPGAASTGQYDGGTFVREESQLAPGAFAGIRYNVRKEIGLELALRNFGMWHYEYVPGSYYTNGYNGGDNSKYGTIYNGQPNSAATESTGTSRGWALDFAITARI